MIEKKANLFKRKVQTIKEIITAHNTGLYASQAAFFFVISLIPTTLLLATMVQFTPVTYEHMIIMIEQMFPSTIHGMLAEIVSQVFNQAGQIIPVTIFIALWAAGRGVLSLASGLNKIFNCTETRNYIVQRVRASIYTILFLSIIILTLVVAVFGNSINLFVHEHIPFLSNVVDFIARMRTIITFSILTVALTFIYKHLPSRNKQNKTTFLKQLTGATVAASSWMLLSYIFSIYLDIFTTFSTIYGSMTTMVLLMLWFYICMHAILFGAKINAYLNRRFFQYH